MSNKGIITKEDIFQQDAVNAPKEYAVNLELAIKNQQRMIEIAKEWNGLSSSAKQIKSTKELNTIQQKHLGLTEQTQIAYKEQDRLEKNLITTKVRQEQATESTNRALIKERLELNKTNREIKEQAIITSNLIGAYQKLNLKRTQAKKTLLDLLASEKASNKEIEKARRNYEQLDKRVRKADESVGDFSKKVGNYKTGVSGLTNGIRSLVGAFGAVEGIRLAFRIGADLLEVSRRAKGVEFAFKNIGYEGQLAFEKVKKSTRGLISDLDIKTSLVTFDNFNLSLDQTNTLFEFLAVTSAQTGVSIDKLKDSLTEGISKKSFQRIDNLGISAEALNKELEQTPDFLEAVAKVAETKIKEAGNILDEAADSQQQFNVALENFKVSAGSGFIKTFTDDVYNIGTALVSVLGDINDTSEGFFDFAAKMFKATQLGGVQQIQTEAVIKREMKSRIPLVEQILKLQKEQGVIELQRIQNKDKLLKTNSEELKQILKKTDLEVNGKKPITKTETEEEKKAREQKEESDKKLREQRIENQKKLNESLKKSEFELAQEILQITIDKNQEIIKDENTTFEEKFKAIQKLKIALNNFNNNQIDEDKRLLKQRLDNNEILQDEYIARLQILGIKSIAINEDLENQITENLKTALGDRLQAQKDSVDQNIKAYQAKANAQKKIDEISLEERKKAISLISEFTANAFGVDANNLGNFISGLIDGFKTFEEGLTATLQLAGDVMNTITNISAGFSEDRIAQIDNEIEKNDEKFNNLLANEELTLEQRSLLEAQKQREQDKLEKKKREEKTKQAKLEKANTLTQIAIQTSLGVISALAQVPKFDFGISATLLAGVIGSIGAVQFALAAARPIPKFKDGHLAGTHQGWAITNDGGKQEILERNGMAHLIQGVNTPIYMQKGDKVYKSEEDYHKRVAQNAFKDLNNQKIRVKKAQELSANDNKINEIILGSYVAKALSQERGTIKKEIKEGLKKIGVTVNINNDSGNTIFKNNDW